MSEQSAIPAETKERIIRTAEELKAQTGKLPSVDQVRRAAKVDMNAASQVMREWRQSLMAHSAPAVVAIPESLQQTAASTIAAIWVKAQELSGEQLRNAQAAWETERTELDAIRAELSNAYESQEDQIAALKIELERSQELATRKAEENETLKSELAQAALEAGKLNTRIEDQEQLIASLRAELEKAREQASTAEVKAARLEGMFDSVSEQNKALMAAIGKKK